MCIYGLQFIGTRVPHASLVTVILPKGPDKFRRL